MLSATVRTFSEESETFYRSRPRFQALLREEIPTVAMPSDIEDELRHLIAVVRA